jgi:hypothetical protein
MVKRGDSAAWSSDCARGPDRQRDLAAVHFEIRKGSTPEPTQYLGDA